MTTQYEGEVAGDVESTLRSFLENRLGRSVEPTLDLFESRLVSSMFAMELIVHLEQSFGVAVVGSDLRLDNFRSIRAMADLVHRLHSAEASGVRDR